MSITQSTTSTTSIHAVPLRPGRWALDPAHSSVSFSIRHLGVSKVRGQFRRFDTEVVVGESLADTSLRATVDLASIDTGNPDRDSHVRSPDLLDVERRPTMAFASRSITGDGSRWTVEGDLTIGDVTRFFALQVLHGGVESYFDGTRHAGFEATGELRRKDFGIDIALPPGVSGAMLGDVVKVELDIQLVEPSRDGD
jgi:polyisoprenoid-binding protein YceI